jgi:hypothetical protein
MRAVLTELFFDKLKKVLIVEVNTVLLIRLSSGTMVILSKSFIYQLLHNRVALKEY